MSLRRGVIVSVGSAGAALFLAGAVAFACITPATVSLSKVNGRPGDVIVVTGASFRAPSDTPNGVQVRWNGADGMVLGEVRPDAEGAFKANVTIPDGPPGYYVVTAVYRDASGENVPGTPGRALYEVVGTAPAPGVTEPAPVFSPASPSGSAFPLALVAGIGAVGLLLFVGGFVAVARGRRDTKVAAPVRRD